jgi:DNA modification methylase
LHYNKPNSGKIPAKPRALIEILLRCFCPDGGNVCDPFTGSGIVAITAEDMARNAFASDISEERVQNVLDKCFADCEERAK